MAGNYDKQVLMSRELFLKYDQQEMVDKFHLQNDEDYIYIQLLDRMHRISRKTGCIEAATEPVNVVSSPIPAMDIGKEHTELNIRTQDFEECLDYNVVMTIYDVLCYSKDPILAHQWVPLASLQVTLSSPGTDTFTQKYADAFSGKVEQLWDVCRQLGGRRPEIMAGADLCWEFDIFPFFPVQFRYWDKDEEFPAQIRLLWDKNSLRFMHFETVYYALHILLNELKNRLCL